MILKLEVLGSIVFGKPHVKGKRQECFENARKEWFKNKSGKYTVGRLVGVPALYSNAPLSEAHRVKHAWVTLNGVVFDATPFGSTPASEFWRHDVQYIPWAEYDVSSLTSPIDHFPDGELVTKLYPAAKKSVWYGSSDFKQIPLLIRKSI